MASFTEARICASRTDLLPLRRRPLIQFTNRRVAVIPNTTLRPQRARITCMAVLHQFNLIIN